MLGSGIAIFGLWSPASLESYPQIWESFLHTNTPALIGVDTHDLHLLPLASTLDRQTLVDLVLHKLVITVDDAAVIAPMAGELGRGTFHTGDLQVSFAAKGAPTGLEIARRTEIQSE